MIALSDITRTWTDTLTTMAVGFLILLIPKLTEVDYLAGHIQIPFKNMEKLLEFVSGPSPAGQFVLVLFLLSVAMAIGSVVVHFGEVFSLFVELKAGNTKTKKRIAAVSENGVLLSIYQTAHSGFRLLCGLGAALILFGVGLVANAISEGSLLIILHGILMISFGLSTIFIFARFSFTYIDWIIFGTFLE